MLLQVQCVYLPLVLIMALQYKCCECASTNCCVAPKLCISDQLLCRLYRAPVPTSTVSKRGRCCIGDLFCFVSNRQCTSSSRNSPRSYRLRRQGRENAIVTHHEKPTPTTPPRTRAKTVNSKIKLRHHKSRSRKDVWQQLHSALWDWYTLANRRSRTRQ